MCLCGEGQQDSINFALRLIEVGRVGREISEVLGPVLGFPVQEI